MMNNIEVRNAEKCFGSGDDRKVVLDGLNLTVAPSTIYALIGSSGCGKTTLLSCILGMAPLDRGSIRILGHNVAYNRTPKICHSIGFMPQNSELVPELTIRETLSYFGNIYLMTKQKLKERSQMIMDLLELPSDNREIQYLSGGEKRRVSLAATIIHDPLILILDEPTVGLDSILRDKIWKFLTKTTHENGLSIVITTHYISEAQQSDQCGMMREGVLLAEDTPKNILLRYNAQDLDEAFLNLCLMKKGARPVPAIHGSALTVIDERREKKFKDRSMFSFQATTAIIKKEFVRVSRQVAEFYFILLFPLLQVCGFSFAIGGLPVNLKLGVVNYEVTNHSMCDYYLNQSGSHRNVDYECVFNYVSCHLVNEIHDDDALKVYYGAFDEALRDAKRGEIMGVVTINRNISTMLTQLFSNADNGKALDSYMDIHMDQSDLQSTVFLYTRLLQAYERFNNKLLGNCDLNEKLLKVPMDFSETIHGTLESDYKRAMYPSFCLQAIMYPAFGFASFAIGQSRIDGVWNRTLVAGVRPIELLIAHVILCVFLQLLTVAEVVVASFMTLGVTAKGSMLLYGAFAFFASINGSLLGTLVSVLSDDLKVISMLLFAFINNICILGGFVWPLEGQPFLLRIVSEYLPITVPTVALRNVMIKGFGIEDPTVVMGLVISIAWMVFSFTCSYLVIMRRTFVRKLP